LFPLVVPASGSFLLCSQEVEESKSPEMGDQKPTTRLGPQFARWRTTLLRITLCVSFPRKRESSVPTMGPRFRGDDADFHSRGRAVSRYLLPAVSAPQLLDCKIEGTNRECV